MKLQQIIGDKFSVALIATAILFLMLPVICAAQGKIVFTSNHEDVDLEIFKMNPDGTNRVRLTNSPGFDIDPAFNKFGSKIVFTSERDGNREIYTMKADGSEVTRLTNNPGVDHQPSFSHDGSKITFVSERDGNPEIYRMNSDGSNQIRMTWEAADDLDPKYSPDDSKIIFTTERAGEHNFEIYSMHATLGWNLVNLTNNPYEDRDPEFNFDGSKIVFTSYRASGMQIFTMNADGSNVIQVTDTYEFNNEHPFFSLDGTKIAFSAIGNGRFDIFVMNADGTSRVDVTNASEGWQYNGQPTWGPKPRNFRLISMTDLLSPDDEPNIYRAGSSVPIDFSLDGFHGNNVYRSPPASQRISCSTRRPTAGAALETINRTQPDVVYNTALEYYTTTWLTQTAWKGTCRRLFLNMDDGSTEMLDFYFK